MSTDIYAGRIELQAFDLYGRIEQIHRYPPASPQTLREKYVLLHKVLEETCYELTAQVTLAFANLFSRLDYICKEKRMTPADKYAIQTMRRNGNAALSTGFHPDMEEYRYDLRALLRFIARTFDTDIPATLLPEIAATNRPYRHDRRTRIPYVRASVTSWDKSRIFAATDNEADPFIVIDYARGGYGGDLLYLTPLLRENLPLNLLDVRIDEEDNYLPGLVVIHPDYLIDISALAACFREYGRHPLNFFLNKIKPKANTAPILLGNLAGQLLDDYINKHPDEPVSYAQSIGKFFARSALEFCTCLLPADFHRQAQAQMANIRSFVQELLPRNVNGFDRGNTLLEASFICEKLGLQGRVDMLQKDFKVLIEQKAGKRDEYNRRHKEDHFVQMMLYQGVLMYNFGREAENLQTFLLYSKYADGLMAEHFSENLFRESIRLRNLIAVQEAAFGEGDVNRVISLLDPSLLNERQVHSRLWTDYQEPQLREAVRQLKQGTPLEQAYFRRFFTFVSKEQVLQKTGGTTDPANGFAGVWHTPLAEKLEAGNILLGLKIADKRQSGPGKGYDTIDLNIPPQGDDFLPNFRNGDIIICYAYRDEPDVRRHILMKGSIADIRPDRLTIVLRNGQQNKDIIGGADDTFAVEHDASDASATAAMRGLFAFLGARTDRKELLLGVRPPRRNTAVTLNGSYGRFDEPVLKAKQAEDCFLLVGPPGTGKTSCALRYMVEEILTDPQASILLLSYTNRAVDEICDMLVASGIARTTPFIRLGNELSCDARFAPYLLKNSLSDCPKLADIRQKLIRTRIFTGTTTALNSRLHLFGLKRFSHALIDEASQILEPDLIGILAARHGEENAVGKFVLIGDYKQLPAIALQSAEEARITDPLLNAAGLDDCRHSLFERLYKQLGDDFRCILHKQGRMHPALAEFPNHAFYFREQLEPIPLPHQEEDSAYTDAPAARDGVDRLLMERRLAFIPVQTPPPMAGTEKANPAEARVVATLLEHIVRLASKRFDPGKTVGVIVPYRNQIAMIRKETARLGLEVLNGISIDTVERYQGSQRDVIIYSFTVSRLEQLNFLTGNTFSEGEARIDRKLNVAITRARKQLLLVGNPCILGADLTFYKLMEHIRLQGGYIEAAPDAFCQGRFALPCFQTDWDVRADSYALPDTFRQAFDAVMEKTRPDTAETDGTDSLRHRELTGYGRHDFSRPDSKETEISPRARAYLYNYYYMRRHYCAARALYEACGTWLFPAVKSVSGRVVFCDLSQESGASGLAFIDACRLLPQTGMVYAGILPSPDMEEAARLFLDTPAYRHITYEFHRRLNAVPIRFWETHSAQSELIVFNLSSLFDRTGPAEAKELALQISQLVQACPLNRYVLIYRNDDGERGNNHTYRTFRSHLTGELHPLNPQMPVAGAFFYRPEALGTPTQETFTYEILVNRRW